MRTLVPDTAPIDPEPWQKIFDDVETVIMPGVSYEDTSQRLSYKKTSKTLAEG